MAETNDFDSNNILTLPELLKKQAELQREIEFLVAVQKTVERDTTAGSGERHDNLGELIKSKAGELRFINLDVERLEREAAAPMSKVELERSRMRIIGLRFSDERPPLRIELED